MCPAGLALTVCPGPQVGALSSLKAYITHPLPTLNTDFWILMLTCSTTWSSLPSSPPSSFPLASTLPGLPHFPFLPFLSCLPPPHPSSLPSFPHSFPSPSFLSSFSTSFFWSLIRPFHVSLHVHQAELWKLVREREILTTLPTNPCAHNLLMQPAQGKHTRVPLEVGTRWVVAWKVWPAVPEGWGSKAVQRSPC